MKNLYKLVKYKYSKLICPICGGKVIVRQNYKNCNLCTSCNLEFQTGAIFIKKEG